MANNISVQSSVTSTVDGFRNTLSSNQNLTTTSSNFIIAEQTIGSAAWTSLTLGSLTDVIYLTLTNDNSVYTGSVVTIATGSAGQNVLTYLTPGAQAVLPWSGALATLYGKVTSGYPFGIATPTSASVGWIVQQS